MFKLPYLPSIQFTTNPGFHTEDLDGAAGTLVSTVNHVVDADIATVAWLQVFGVTDHNNLLVGIQDNTVYRFAPLDERRSQVSSSFATRPPWHGSIPPFFVPPIHPHKGRRGGRRWTIELEKTAGAADPATILIAHCGVRPWPEGHLLADEEVWNECVWIPWRAQVTLSFEAGDQAASSVTNINDPVLITGAASSFDSVVPNDIRVQVESSGDGANGPLTGQTAMHPHILAPVQQFTPVGLWMGGYWIDDQNNLRVYASRSQNLLLAAEYGFTFYGYSRGDL